MSETLLSAATPSAVEAEVGSVTSTVGGWVNVIVRRQPSPLAATLREVAASAWHRLTTTTPNARCVDERVVREDDVVLHLKEVHVANRSGGDPRVLLQAVCFTAGESYGHLDVIEVTAVIALGADPQRELFTRHVAAVQRAAS